jgi:hypothetical protein
MGVVVLDLAAENSLQMACVYDQQVVKTLGSDSPHDPLGVGIGVRGPERSA